MNFSEIFESLKKKQKRKKLNDVLTLQEKCLKKIKILERKISFTCF